MAPKPRGKGKVALATMLAEKREQQAFVDPMSSLGRPPTRAEIEEMEAQEATAAPAAASAPAAPAAAPAVAPKKVVAPQPQPKKAQQQVGAGFIPPGACASSRACKNAFERQFERHFVLPPRLRQVPSPLIEAVNDFHYAMMNDLPRNEFYYQLLKKHIEPGVTGVLEIGAGSGLLSMMAASLGAKWVVAVEGSADMARLAQMNVDANNMGDRVRVLNKMSFDLTLKDLPARPDVLVSEIFGTLMLGESALEYLEDVRARKILKPEAAILPRFGKQYAVLVECPILEKICSVDTWKGLSLSHMNRLVDTASCVFTKKYGFRMSDVSYKRLTEPIELVHVDFTKTRVEDLPMEYALQAKVIASGTAHAALYYWVAYQDDAEFHALMKISASGEESEEATAARNVALMSTDPADTRINFPRDMQWGQALQLLDAAEQDMPTPVKLVAAADGAPAATVAITCRTSEDRVTLQLEVMPASS